MTTGKRSLRLAIVALLLAILPSIAPVEAQPGMGGYPEDDVVSLRERRVIGAVLAAIPLVAFIVIWGTLKIISRLHQGAAWLRRRKTMRWDSISDLHRTYGDSYRVSICSHCGRPVSKNVSRCGYCGQQVHTSDEKPEGEE